MAIVNIDFRSHKWAIIYCGVSAIGALCYGYDQIYYTGLLGMKPFIDEYGTRNSTGTTALTTSFTSLTSSIIYIGELLGALFAAPINDHYGRKAVFYCASGCIIAGAIVQLAASGLEGLIVLGRIFVGLGIGQFTVTSLLYIGEVAPVAVRGPALMMFQLMQSCSQLVGSGITQGTEAISSRDAYMIPMGILIALPSIMVLCLPFTPESPMWYMIKGRDSEAERALTKVNRSLSDYDPASDMAAIREAARHQDMNHGQSSWSSLLKDLVERRKLLFSCGAMVAQQINGIQFFYSYGVIFAQSIGIKEPFTISLITNVLQVISVAVSVLLGNKVPRRSNMLVCSLGLTASLLVVGGLGTTTRPFTSGISTSIVVFSYVVIVCYNFSLGPLAFTIASEMAVGPNRNKIMSCSIVSFFFTVWVISFTSPYMYYSANLGPMVGFVYAGTSVFTLLYVWFCVGETRGRTHQQIERLFRDGIPAREWDGHVFVDMTHLEDRAVAKGQVLSEQVERA